MKGGNFQIAFGIICIGIGIVLFAQHLAKILILYRLKKRGLSAIGVILHDSLNPATPMRKPRIVDFEFSDHTGATRRGTSITAAHPKLNPVGAEPYKEGQSIKIIYLPGSIAHVYDDLPTALKTHLMFLKSSALGFALGLILLLHE